MTRKTTRGTTLTLTLVLLAVAGMPAAAQEPAAPPAPAPPAETAPAGPAAAETEAGEPETIELVPIPEPDLSGLEPEVAEQLQETRSQLQGLLGRPDATPASQAEALGELGRLYHAYELNQSAEAAYYDAHLLAPEDPRWSYYLAYLYQQLGEFEKAATLYGRGLERQPTLAALVHLAESYIALERLDEAERVLRYALSNSPDLPSVRALMGEIALSRKEYSLALEYLEAALEAVPEATRLHYPIALAYRGLGETETAKEHLALRGEPGIRPPDPLIDELNELKRGERVHVLRGRTAFRAGDYAGAAREFRKAVEADPESVGARVNLGSALGQSGDRIGAIHQYRKALELSPDNPTALFNLAVLLSQEGKNDEAIAHLRKAAELDPRDGSGPQRAGEGVHPRRPGRGGAGGAAEGLRPGALRSGRPPGGGPAPPQPGALGGGALPNGLGPRVAASGAERGGGVRPPPRRRAGSVDPGRRAGGGARHRPDGGDAHRRPRRGPGPGVGGGGPVRRGRDLAAPGAGRLPAGRRQPAHRPGAERAGRVRGGASVPGARAPGRRRGRVVTSL